MRILAGQVKDIPIMAAKQPHPLMQNRAAGLSPIAAGMLRAAAVALDGWTRRTAEVALASVLVLAPDCRRGIADAGCGAASAW